jgi:hypothetical protein
MGSAAKMRAMFEMFEFALRQARIGTRRCHPDWTEEQIETEARRLVTGTELHRGGADARCASGAESGFRRRH